MIPGHDVARGTTAEALVQIEGKGYAEPFSTDPRELHLIGATFDSATRRLANWQERYNLMTTLSICAPCHGFLT